MPRIYMNTDINTGTFPFYHKLAEREKITPAMLYPYVDVHRLTATTDFLVCTFCQFSASASDVFADYSDLVLAGRNDNNTPDTLSKADAWSALEKIQRTLRENYGTDVYATIFDRCRQVGFNPWISFRMNDCHNSAVKVPICEKDFFARAVRNGWTVGEDYGYFKTCLDYEVDEVRETFLRYIEEQLMRYNVYGVELDFMREYHCFKYLSADMEKCTALMTDFIRKAKGIVTKAEEKHGHKIKLALHILRDEAHCKTYGFDIVTMAKEGLIDVIIPAPRFNSADSGIDVDEWRKIANGAEIVTGLEAAAGIVDGKFVDTSKEIALGICAGYLSYNPDGLYFYNHFISPHMFSNFYTPLCKYEEFRVQFNEPWMKSYGVLQSAGSYEDIYKNALRFAIIPESDDHPDYCPKWKPLPAEINSKDKTFTIRTGKIPSGKTYSVILGFVGEACDFSVTVNGVEIQGFSENPLDFIEGIGWQPEAVVPKGTVCYRAAFDSAILTSPTQTVTVKSKTPVTLNWLEINLY